MFVVFKVKLAECTNTMSADLLLSLFFTLSIHGTMRKGHEEDCTVWRECLCLLKYVQVCVVQKSHSPPVERKKRRFTGFFCLAAIPVTGQLCPSCSNKMCHYLTWVSILHLRSCNTSTGVFLFPLSLLVWILSYPLNWAGQKVWRSRWWRRGEKRGDGGPPLSHPLRVAVPVHSASGE